MLKLFLLQEDVACIPSQPLADSMTGSIYGWDHSYIPCSTGKSREKIREQQRQQ
jgi:hypothetical protein